MDFQKVAGMNTPDRVYKLHSNANMEEAWVYPTRQILQEFSMSKIGQASSLEETLLVQEFKTIND